MMNGVCQQDAYSTHLFWGNQSCLDVMQILVDMHDSVPKTFSPPAAQSYSSYLWHAFASSNFVYLHDSPTLSRSHRCSDTTKKIGQHAANAACMESWSTISYGRRLGSKMLWAKELNTSSTISAILPRERPFALEKRDWISSESLSGTQFHFTYDQCRRLPEYYHNRRLVRAPKYRHCSGNGKFWEHSEHTG